MSKNDGGPAFTSTELYVRLHDDVPYDDKQGMYLRDYFAAAIMTGLVSSTERTAALYKVKGERSSAEAMAEYVGEIADAMLAERAK